MKIIGTCSQNSHHGEPNIKSININSSTQIAPKPRGVYAVHTSLVPWKTDKLIMANM